MDGSWDPAWPVLPAKRLGGGVTCPREAPGSGETGADYAGPGARLVDSAPSTLTTRPLCRLPLLSLRPPNPPRPYPEVNTNGTHLSRTGWKGDFNCCAGESGLGMRSLSAREGKRQSVRAQRQWGEGVPQRGTGLLPPHPAPFLGSVSRETSLPPSGQASG